MCCRVSVGGGRKGWEGRTARTLLDGGCPDVIREGQRDEVEACGLVPPVFVHLLGLQINGRGR